MKRERYIQVLVSLFIAGVLFAIGFYAGNKNKPTVSVNLLNATSTVSADMEPFWKAWQLLEERFSPSSSTTELVSDQQKFGEQYKV